MTERTLVAGIGNIFLSDDGFGSEVARRLVGLAVPDGVRIEDFGIRGVHLAYEILNGYDTVVLIDAVDSSEPPGTVSVIQPDLSGEPDSVSGLPVALDAHGMDPVAVLAMVRDLGGTLNRVLLVGCQPASLEEGIGLSAPVADAVDPAVQVVRDLIVNASSLGACVEEEST
jgi:hydrogenase maturation protease